MAFVSLAADVGAAVEGDSADVPEWRRSAAS